MNGTIITNKGIALIAKLTSGTGTGINFTRASVGTGRIPTGYDPAGMINLNQYKMDGKISGCSASEGEATVIFQIGSNDVEEGFVITEAGLFAEDPDEGEILYSYLDLSDDPQYIYAQNSTIQKFAEIEFKTIIGRIENITVNMSPGALVTKEEFEEAIKEKIDGAGGDISDTRITPESPPEVEGEAVKYPEIEESGTTKGILGKIQRWAESLKDDKIDSSGGDTAETVVSEIKESAEVFPIPAAKDDQKTLWGKVKKWQQDCLTKFGNYVLASMITNQHLNDTNRIPTSALVYLMQQSITQLNSDLSYRLHVDEIRISTHVNRVTGVFTGEQFQEIQVTQKGWGIVFTCVWSSGNSGDINLFAIEPYHHTGIDMHAAGPLYSSVASANPNKFRGLEHVSPIYVHGDNAVLRYRLYTSAPGNYNFSSVILRLKY